MNKFGYMLAMVAAFGTVACKPVEEPKAEASADATEVPSAPALEMPAEESTEAKN